MNKPIMRASHKLNISCVCLLVSLVFSLSCKKNNDTLSKAACNLTAFPSVAGNYWTYKVTTLMDYDHLNDSTSYDTLYLSVVKDTLYKGMTLQKIEGYSKNNPYRSFSLCANTTSAFVAYFSEPGRISEVLRVKDKPAGSMNLFNDEKLLIPDTTLTTILNFNEGEWIYRENALVQMEKENIGKGTVMTPKGSFDCCKYQIIYLRNSFPQQIDIIEYFAEQGLIRKTRNILNATFTDSYGNPIDTGNYYETIELIDYSLH